MADTPSDRTPHAQHTSPRPPRLSHPPASTTAPLAVVSGSLDGLRDRILSKLDGLPDAALRAAAGPLTWSPLGLVRHLTWVERRWMRWGFLAETIDPYPRDGDEWRVDAAEPLASVLADYRAEVAHSRAVAGAAGFETVSLTGGRFDASEAPPTLGRILVHLHQEYSRHLGHLDVARELIDGATGE